MRTLLVRHARTVPRSAWSGEDLLRPLDEVGIEQAAALSEHLAADPPARIVCAPELRCQQTVHSLAARLGIEVEIDDRLAEGEPVSRSLELLPTFDGGPLLLCTHADSVVGMLRILELVDVDRPKCREGSVWVLEGRGYTPSRATYHKPASQTRRANRKAGSKADGSAGSDAPTRGAVLDLGSTSFNLLIADVTPDGGISPVVREKVMLRLGAVIGAGQEISEEMCLQAVEVARELSELGRREKVEHFFPVATAALRAAANGRQVAHRIGAALGHPIRVLSGEEEARIIFRAFQQRLALGTETTMGLDLGGGSLELAVGSGSGVERERTFELGVVRLHNELVSWDPMKRSEKRAIRRRVRETLRPHVSELRGSGIDAAIATGGTVRALVRLLEERRAPRERRDGGLALGREALRELRRTLVPSSHDERLRMRGIRKGRADLLPTGAVIMETVADVFELESFRICDWGLREGVLLAGLVDRAAESPHG